MRRLICLFLIAGVAGPGLCQEMGRLFTTPAERIALERWRAGGPPPASSETPSPKPQSAIPPAPERAAPEPEQVIVVNGVVTRSGSGRTTTWINDVPYPGTARLKGNIALMPGRAAPAVAITLRSGKQVTVKPGQSVDPSSGRVKEAY